MLLGLQAFLDSRMRNESQIQCVDFVFITYFIFQCLCLKINALLRYFVCVLVFSERLFEGLCLSVSPLIGCTGSSILHRESSILRCLPHIPLSVLTQHGQRRIRLLPCATTRNTAAPLHAEHAHGFSIRCRDGEWTGPQPRAPLNGCFPPLGFPVTDTAMSTCCARHTCSGQDGDPGNGARPSVGVAFKLAAEPARMVLTVQAVMW